MEPVPEVDGRRTVRRGYRNVLDVDVSVSVWVAVCVSTGRTTLLRRLNKDTRLGVSRDRESYTRSGTRPKGAHLVFRKVYQDGPRVYEVGEGSTFTSGGTKP